MLTQLFVKNLAVVAELQLDFARGMQVITGETGAGKSIIIDALAIALGERATSEQIRSGCEQAEVTAGFDINLLPRVQELLSEQDLPSQECVIRRVISADGRSRAYINGRPVAVGQIKLLAPYLVQIHGQHQHHALLNSDYQRELLDEYAGNQELCREVKQLQQAWQQTQQDIIAQTNLQGNADRLSLLSYQLQEIENLALQENEFERLELQHKQMSQAENLLAVCENVTTRLKTGSDDERAIVEQLHTVINEVNSIIKIAPQLNSSVSLLKQAIINVDEAVSEVENYFAKLELDPQQLVNIDQRLTQIYNLARKLKIKPDEILQHAQLLVTQRDELANAQQNIEILQQRLQQLDLEYRAVAKILSDRRKAAAQQLAKEIVLRLQNLELAKAKFEIVINSDFTQIPSSTGCDQINYLISTNPGQAPGLLKKIASGGELSRVSLAIQVITAQKAATPTLILDEVDVGISGKTAATVGAIMRELSNNAQIIAITHLPQVAAQGHYHYKVEKHQTESTTQTRIFQLNSEERVNELARLMGGAEITIEARAHARKLLELV